MPAAYFWAYASSYHPLRVPSCIYHGVETAVPCTSMIDTRATFIMAVCSCSLIAWCHHLHVLVCVRHTALSVCICSWFSSVEGCAACVIDAHLRARFWCQHVRGNQPTAAVSITVCCLVEHGCSNSVFLHDVLKVRQLGHRMKRAGAAVWHGSTVVVVEKAVTVLCLPWHTCVE